MKSVYPAICFSLLLSAASLIPISLRAAETPPQPGDWPQWRGPNRDGVSTETGWSTQWPAPGPKVLWKAKVGVGHSCVSVVGDRLYTMGFWFDLGPDGRPVKVAHGPRPGNDAVWCLDAATGQVVWKHAYPSTGDDTFCTPTVYRGRVYTLGRLGQIYCLDAATGAVVWNKDLKSDFAADKPYYGYACCPLAVDDLLVLECGGGADVPLVLGLNNQTGAVVWKCSSGKAGYSSPIPCTVHGKQCVILLSSALVHGIDLHTGQELWTYPWKQGHGGVSECTTPIVQGDKLFLSGSGNAHLSVLLQLTEGQPKELWNHPTMANYFQSSVAVNGFLYGTHTQDHVAKTATFRCVSFDAGEVKWEQGGFGHAPVAAADGKLIILSDKGDLIIADASPAGFKELARAKPLSGECWAAPVLSHGRIYCRNHGGELVCLDVAKAAPRE